MDETIIAKVEQLIARQEILDCLTRYCRGMDRQDREMVRSAFHPDAVDVHQSITTPVDDFLDWTFAYHAAQKFHQHYITNHSVEIDGDIAHSEVYYVFVGTYPDPDTRVTCAGGRYVDRLERRDGAWRIATRYCTSEWYTEGAMPATIALPIDDAGVIETAAVLRSRDDLSYSRPLTATIGTRAAAS